jgi:hypothetical protein
MIRRIAAATAASTLALAGVALAAQSGTYSGKTSQRKGTISLKVSGHKVVHVAFVDGTGVGAKCGPDGAVDPQFPVSFSSHMTIGAHGTFSGTASPRQLEAFKISGRFTGKSVSGSFTDSIPIGQDTGNGFTCKSGKVTFKASLSKGT